MNQSSDGVSLAALVAGGSGGVGQAICRRLAAGGYAVAVGYRNSSDAAQGVVDDIAGSGGRAIALRMDLGDEASVAAAVDEAGAALGGIDAAVYAAGPYVQMRRVGDVSPGMMREML